MSLTTKLIHWYDKFGRDLPWRRLPGGTPDVYRVWLSEIMLQQTMVRTVRPYYDLFLQRWPTVEALAEANIDEILTAWSGLGYYARARNLHKCAQMIVERGNGFPRTVDEWLVLPGIGPYTAAAIAAIAFNQPVMAVDGNVERVIARLYGIEKPLPSARSEIFERGSRLIPASRPGDFLQALMDLGATICTPKKTECHSCPWSDECKALRIGKVQELPRKTPRQRKSLRYALAFWITDNEGHVFLRRRSETGLLGGMMEIPSTPWTDKPWTLEEAIRQAPVAMKWTQIPGMVQHKFSHFDIEFGILTAHSKRARPKVEGGEWYRVSELSQHPLPTLMRKIVRHI